MLALVLATVIYSTTSATSDSGGNSVDSGGTVTTGSVSATSEVVGTVNGGSGTVVVEATATANGETSHKSETIEITSEEPIEIQVSASASSTGAGSVKTEATAAPLVPAPKPAQTIEVIDTNLQASAGSDVLSTAPSVEPKGLVESIFQTISKGLSAFVGTLFGWMI